MSCIFTTYTSNRRDHADSNCIAFFCTGKSEMPFEFEKYIPLGIVHYIQ